MKEFWFCLIACLLFNIILFVTCALPWYGVIAVSVWYTVLAIPCTFFGGAICVWIGEDLWDVWNGMWDDAD